MSIGIRRHWEAVNYEELVTLFQPPEEYFGRAFFDDRQTIDRMQLARIRGACHPGRADPLLPRSGGRLVGRELGSPRSLRSGALPHLLRRRHSDEHQGAPAVGGLPRCAAVRCPPRADARVHVRWHDGHLHVPPSYTQWDRATSSLLAARALYRQGVRPGDIVLNSYQYGTHNGGALFDEAFYNWLNCVVVTTSSGTVTPTERQVALAAGYGASVIYTTGDHLLRIAQVARDLGLDPARDLKLRVLPGLGDIKSPEEIRELLDLFGIDEYFHTYGFHEVGMVAVECPEHDGLHILRTRCSSRWWTPKSGEAGHRRRAGAWW